MGLSSKQFTLKCKSFRNMEEMEQVKISIKSKKSEIVKLDESIKSVSEQLRNIRDIVYRICQKIEVNQSCFA